MFETRPVYHQRDGIIRGHVFCSFLALALRKELDSRLSRAGYNFEWSDIKQDLKALQQVVIEEKVKTITGYLWRDSKRQQPIYLDFCHLSLLLLL